MARLKKQLLLMAFILVCVIYGMDTSNLIKTDEFLELDNYNRINRKATIELETNKQCLMSKFNDKLEENPIYCTHCAQRYDVTKVFTVDSKNKACLKCIMERYPETHAVFCNTYNSINLARFYDKPHKDGYIPAQFIANTLFCALSICIYEDPYYYFKRFNENSNRGEVNAVDRAGATTRAILPFFFGLNAILTIVHAFTKYSERLKECPFSIIPTKGAGFQLFLSSLASIFYWVGDQRSIVGDCILIYGCVDQLLLWTGQNIGVKLHDPSYVNDWEFGIQKGLMNCKGQQIPQNVLANAWVQGSKWGVKKPLFAFAQIFLFLNFVSSITLCPYFNNTDEIGISNNTLGNLLIIVDIMCWVFIVFGVFVSTFAYDAAQGPVLSMNVLTRIAVVAVFAGLDTFELSTKMALNFGSIVALIGGFVVPWEKMFESVTTCLAKKKKKRMMSRN